MATLHLMVGLPGSGKTTEARRLEEEFHALRLTPDEWHLKFYGDDFEPGGDNRLHDMRHAKVEALMWEVAERALRLGTNVILDFGCWAKEEREALREKARAAGAGFRIHYMECAVETLWARLEERNRQAGALPVFRIGREEIERWSEGFEPPDEEEMR